jgi:hypothetical protein
METFPRKGVELSANCELLFNDAEYDRPAHVVRFENGSREARFRTAAGAFNFSVAFTGDDNDFQVMMDFIDIHGVVTPFTLVHPDYGTGTANFRDQKIPIAKVVRGNPRWRRIEIAIEGQF